MNGTTLTGKPIVRLWTKCYSSLIGPTIAQVLATMGKTRLHATCHFYSAVVIKASLLHLFFTNRGCHSPRQIWMNMKKNREKKSEWYRSPPPPYLIGDLWKVFTRKEERKALLHDIVNIYPQFKTKKHTLQVKGLYNRAGIDQVKRLKIMDQLQKRLKWIIFIVTAEGGNPF